MRGVGTARKAAAAILLCAALASCDSAGNPILSEPSSSVSASAPPTSPQLTRAAVNAATTALATIPVRPIPGRDPSYKREAFGDAWSDAGVGIASARNGCDTRNDILRRDARPGTARFKPGTRDCKVTGGTWISPYTGATIKTTTVIDIDHIVPLARAWSAGAKSWPPQTRLNFANDPDNLVATDRKSNRSKSDLGPSAWRPPKPFQCAYAVSYIRATKKYALPLTSSDVAALRNMLSTCTVAQG
jgi:hypothetical protein